MFTETKSKWICRMWKSTPYLLSTLSTFSCYFGGRIKGIHGDRDIFRAIHGKNDFRIILNKNVLKCKIKSILEGSAGLLVLYIFTKIQWRRSWKTNSSLIYVSGCFIFRASYISMIPKHVYGNQIKMNVKNVEEYALSFVVLTYFLVWNHSKGWHSVKNASWLEYG